LLKTRYPGTFGIGVELNEKAAAAARDVFDLVLCGDVTDGRLLATSVDLASIDTVLMLDVIDHVYNPWQLLKNLHPFLTPDAQIVASIPNSFNVQLLEELASGNWHYDKHGLLDITHIRFFTLRSMYELFEQTGYDVRRKSGVPHPPSMLPQQLARTTSGIETEHLTLKKQAPERVDEVCQIQYLLLVSPKNLDRQEACPPITPPSSRNSPCPCGSGERYKNCCGRLGGVSEKDGAVVPQNLSGLMHAALAKQKTGEFSSARQLYQQAIELNPANADALHMMGVMAYMEGDLESAERYILDARKNCQVEMPMIEGNLALVRGARLMGEQMAGFCAGSLPNLRHRLHDSSMPLPHRQQAVVSLLVDFSMPGTSKNVVALHAEMARLKMPPPLILAVNEVQSPLAGGIVARQLTPDTLQGLKHSTVLVWGIWNEFGHWVDRSSPERLVLYCNSDNPERVVAAVNFTSVLGDPPVELLFSSTSIKDQLGLPGVVLNVPTLMAADPHHLSPEALTQLVRVLTQSH
jgi:tetratricopeptide (TPR) repeat protein